jgi:hypothetical protein
MCIVRRPTKWRLSGFKCGLMVGENTRDVILKALEEHCELEDFSND